MEKDNSAQTDVTSTSMINSRQPQDPTIGAVYPQEEHSFDFIFSFDSDFNQSSPDKNPNPIAQNQFSYSTPKRPSDLYSSPENFLFTESLLVNPNSSRSRPITNRNRNQLPQTSQDLFHPVIYPSADKHITQGGTLSNLRGDRFQIPQRDPGPSVTQIERKGSSGALSLDLSKELFGSPPSAIGELLLESPGDTPAQFHAAQLRIDSSILSDSELSVLSDIQSKEEKGAAATQKGDFDRRKKLTSARSLSFDEKEEILLNSTLDDPHSGVQVKRSIESDSIRSGKMELEEAYSTDYDMLSMDGNMAVHPDIDESSYPSRSKAGPKVVDSPSTTEEALALQRAVIGNSKASPASMDEINATIAAVQQQYRERLDKLGNERSSLLEEDDEETNQEPNGDKKMLHASTSSLDEMPTKLPASHDDGSSPEMKSQNDLLREPEVVPPPPHPGSLSRDAEQPRQPPAPVTISKKPASLMAQNTTLALQNAVSGKFNNSPTAGPGVGAGPSGGIVHGRILHRNPIEGVTTHRGGRTMVAPKETHPTSDSTDSSQPDYTDGYSVGEPASDHSQTLPNGIPGSLRNDATSVPQNQSEIATGMALTETDSTVSGSGEPGTKPEVAELQRESNASSQTLLPQQKPLPPLFPVRRKDMNKLPSTSLRQSSKPRVGSSGDSDVMQLLREKANLEGQIEMLNTETEAALQSRAELQAQVAGLQAQMRSQKLSLDQSTQEKATSENYMKRLRANRNELEDRVLNLQNNLEMKDNGLEDVKKELEGSKEANNKLDRRLGEVKRDVENKEMQMAKLREKVALLENKLENSIDSGSQSSADMRTLQADLLSAQKTKDWFQDQLHLAQDDRNKLQRELSSTQEKIRGDALSIELLKTANSQIKQQLNETRQQSLLEKEQIAKHLETIEADILAREAGFAEIQREKLAVHDAVLAQMNEMEMEKHKVANLVASAVELERQLEATQKELADKKNKLFEAEAEKKELVKDLTLAQESVSNKDRELESAEIKNKDTEARLNEKTSRSETLDDEMARLRADKTSLEAALIAANEEKRSFDEALQRLRGDMEKVEKNYRQMADEVSARDSQLEEMKREKTLSEDKLQGAEEQLKEEQENSEGYAAVLGNKDTLLKGLEQSNENLQAELEHAKADLEEARETSLSSQASIQALQDGIQKTGQVVQIREHQLQEALTQNANLQGQLETMKEDRNNYSVLLEENKALKEKISDTQNAAHREGGDQKAKILRLGADLKALRKELKERQQSHEQEIARLNDSLTEVENAKAMAEETLQTAKDEAADMSKAEQRQMSEALMRTINDLETLKQEKSKSEAALGETTRARDRDNSNYQARIADLEADLENLREILAEMKKNEGDNRKMAIELERERGRLSGVHQSHAALKQHAGLLEAALARRESTMTELNEQLTATSQEKALEENKLQQLVKEFEEGLQKEKAMSKDLRKQLASEKGKTRRSKETLRNKDSEIKELQGELEQKSSEVGSAALALDNMKKSEDALKEQLEASKNEIDGARAQIELLQRYLQDSIAQNPVLEDQMKTLAWECEQKAREVDAMKEQMELADKRQRLEMDGIKNSLKMSKQELEALKRELAGTRKDKFAFQAKVGQLKAALKATVQQNQLLKAKLRAKKAQQQNSSSTPNPVDEIVVPEMAYDVEALLASDDIGNLSSGESKPLQALHGCLQSIRSQMGALEKQLGEHQAAIHSSQEAWREVGDRVRDLRKACASSVPPRQASPLPPESAPQEEQQQPPAQVITSHNSGQAGQTTSMNAPSLPGVYDI